MDTRRSASLKINIAIPIADAAAGTHLGFTAHAAVVAIAVAGRSAVAAAEQRAESRNAGGGDTDTDFESGADGNPGRGPEEVVGVQERVDEGDTNDGRGVATDLTLVTAWNQEKR